MTRTEALTLALFAMNDVLHPDASDAADRDYWDTHAEDAISELHAMREAIADFDADAEGR